MDETDAGFLRLVRRRKRHERERNDEGRAPFTADRREKIKELDGWRGNGLAPIDNDVLERGIRPLVVAELGPAERAPYWVVSPDCNTQPAIGAG